MIGFSKNDDGWLSAEGSLLPFAERYPDFVPGTDDAKLRWDLALSVAATLLGEDSSPAQIRFAAMALFHDEGLPTS